MHGHCGMLCYWQNLLAGVRQICLAAVVTELPCTWTGVNSCLGTQVNDAMLKEDRRWLSDRQRLNATFSMFIKRMESLVRQLIMVI